MTRHNLELFFRWIVDGKPPSDSELDPFRASARLRAIEGLALEDLLQGYRTGARLAWNAVLDVAAGEEREALLHAADVLMLYVDVVSSAVTRAYLDEREAPSSRDERGARRMIETLCGDLPPVAEDIELAERLGFRIQAEYHPFAASRSRRARVSPDWPSASPPSRRSDSVTAC